MAKYLVYMKVDAPTQRRAIEKASEKTGVPEYELAIADKRKSSGESSTVYVEDVPGVLYARWDKKVEGRIKVALDPRNWDGDTIDELDELLIIARMETAYGDFFIRGYPRDGYVKPSVED